jgi:hypothetical protein
MSASGPASGAPSDPDAAGDAEESLDWRLWPAAPPPGSRLLLRALDEDSAARPAAGRESRQPPRSEATADTSWEQLSRALQPEEPKYAIDRNSGREYLPLDSKAGVFRSRPIRNRLIWVGSQTLCRRSEGPPLTASRQHSHLICLPCFR